jgi:hypothetical protein
MTGGGIDFDQPSPAAVGTASGFGHVFIAAGPVEADGVTWWRISPTWDRDGRLGAPYALVGWIGVPHGGSAWMVMEDPCPPRPVSLDALTYTKASWALGLGCFGGEVLVLRGWYAGPPDGSEPNDCDAQPSFLCTMTSVFPVERGWGPGNEARLDFYLDPSAGIVLPTPGQWVDVAGMYDHPIARSCGHDADLAELACRYDSIASVMRPAPR